MYMVQYSERDIRTQVARAAALVSPRVPYTSRWPHLGRAYVRAWTGGRAVD
jgi:hypothetical protein